MNFGYRTAQTQIPLSPENTEENEEQASIGCEERGGPQDLWKEPFYIVIFLPSPQNGRYLQGTVGEPPREMIYHLQAPKAKKPFRAR